MSLCQIWLGGKLDKYCIQNVDYFEVNLIQLNFNGDIINK